MVRTAIQREVKYQYSTHSSSVYPEGSSLLAAQLNAFFKSILLSKAPYPSSLIIVYGSSTEQYESV